jgi:hypothetical protein
MRGKDTRTDDTCDMEFETEVWFARFTLKFGKGLAPKWDVEKLCFFSKVGSWFEEFHTFGDPDRGIDPSCPLESDYGEFYRIRDWFAANPHEELVPFLPIMTVVREGSEYARKCELAFLFPELVDMPKALCYDWVRDMMD